MLKKKETQGAEKLNNIDYKSSIWNINIEMI